MANGNVIHSSGERGSLHGISSNTQFTIPDVHIVNDINDNLQSVSTSLDYYNNQYGKNHRGHKAVFWADGAEFQTHNNRTMLTIPRVGNLYQYTIHPADKISNVKPFDWPSFHVKHAHISPELAKTAFPQHKSEIPSKYDCVECIKSKLIKRPTSHTPADYLQEVGQIVYADVMILPSDVSYFADMKYILVFLDAYSQYRWILPASSKAQLPAMLKFTLQRFQHVTGKNIQVLRTDPGTEFMNYTVQHANSSEGVQHQWCNTGDHQGHIENVIRHIRAQARADMENTDVPNELFYFALEYVAQNSNTWTRKTNSKSPYELFTGKSPSLHSHGFGVGGWFLKVPKELSKIQAQGVYGQFLGYAHNPMSSQSYTSFSTSPTDTVDHTVVSPDNILTIPPDDHDNIHQDIIEAPHTDNNLPDNSDTDIFDTAPTTPTTTSPTLFPTSTPMFPIENTLFDDSTSGRQLRQVP